MMMARFSIPLLVLTAMLLMRGTEGREVVLFGDGGASTRTSRDDSGHRVLNAAVGAEEERVLSHNANTTLRCVRYRPAYKTSYTHNPYNEAFRRLHRRDLLLLDSLHFNCVALTSLRVVEDVGTLLDACQALDMRVVVEFEPQALRKMSKRVLEDDIARFRYYYTAFVAAHTSVWGVQIVDKGSRGIETAQLANAVLVTQKLYTVRALLCAGRHDSRACLKPLALTVAGISGRELWYAYELCACGILFRVGVSTKDNHCDEIW
jgi:hypothetical protein